MIRANLNVPQKKIGRKGDCNEDKNRPKENTSSVTNTSNRKKSAESATKIRPVHFLEVEKKICEQILRATKAEKTITTYKVGLFHLFRVRIQPTFIGVKQSTYVYVPFLHPSWRVIFFVWIARRFRCLL